MRVVAVLGEVKLGETMNDWGWNPSTVQVVISSMVGFFTLALILFVS